MRTTREEVEAGLSCWDTGRATQNQYCVRAEKDALALHNIVERIQKMDTRNRHHYEIVEQILSIINQETKP